MDEVRRENEFADEVKKCETLANEGKRSDVNVNCVKFNETEVVFRMLIELLIANKVFRHELLGKIGVWAKEF